MAAVHNLGFSNFLNIWSPVRLGCLTDLCIVLPNFIKLVTVAEISQLKIFNMAVVRHLRFLKVWFFGTVFRIWRANMRQRAKFCRNRWNSCWDIAIYPFFQDGGHFGFVGQILGRPTTRIWWYLSLCKIWLEKICQAENWTAFLARDVIYISRAYAMMPVSVCLSTVCDGSALAHYS